MKITRILNFTEDEIQTLVAAGKLLAALEAEFNAESPDNILLGDETKELVNALKTVLFKLDHDNED